MINSESVGKSTYLTRPSLPIKGGLEVSKVCQPAI